MVSLTNIRDKEGSFQRAVQTSATKACRVDVWPGTMHAPQGLTWPRTPGFAETGTKAFKDSQMQAILVYFTKIRIQTLYPRVNPACMNQHLPVVLNLSQNAIPPTFPNTPSTSWQVGKHTQQDQRENNHA